MNEPKQYLKPRKPKGFREYLPQEQALFDSVYHSIEKTFQLNGFAHIVTPDLELSEIMLAKGGGETEKEVYRFTKGSTDYCLPYDLTIPTARYICEHLNEIVFPFYRYQIQKRYRAENTQRGRAREFYQADIDIFGIDNTNADALIISTLYRALLELDLPPFSIHIGHRGLWSGFRDMSTNDQVELMHLVDKKNKLSQSDFDSKLSQLSISDRDLDLLNILLNPSSDAILDQLESLPSLDSRYLEVITEIRGLYNTLSGFGVNQDSIVFDPSIVRGLDYYNGVVFETFFDHGRSFGSISSGGRYNRLLEHFSSHKIPAVGGSIGLTRLFEYILEQQNQPKSKQNINTPAVIDIFIAYQPNQSLYRIYDMATKLQGMGLKTSFNLEHHDLSRQMRYAQKMGVGRVLIVKNIDEPLILKDMNSGSQEEISMLKLEQFLCK